jgi:hypothetical protein
MVAARHGGEGYLETLGRELHPDLDIFWTGPEIISETLELDPIARLTEILRRPPLIWDNLFANDYDGRRFFCGPYAGRPLGLRQAVRGILLNPNTEFPLNFVPIHSFGAYLRAGEGWDARASFLEGVEAWFRHFATVGAPLDYADLVTFADCFYLPYEEGTEADCLGQDIARCLSNPRPPSDPDSLAVRARMLRLKDFCARLVDLTDRALFHAVHRRVWDLREELDLIDRWWAHRIDPARKAFASVPQAGNGLINRVMWKYEGWLQGYNGGPLRHPTARIYQRDMTALRRGQEAAGLNPTSDPDEQFFIGRNPA